MLPRDALFVVVILGSFSLTRPQKWLQKINQIYKKVDKLSKKTDLIDLKTNRIDSNVQIMKDELEYALDEQGLLILHIEIDNELSVGIGGDIVYSDDYRQQYSVSYFSVASIIPKDNLAIKKITGKTVNGVVCSPFISNDDEEPKQRFHIVAGTDGGCVVLPASEQYHHIQPIHWYEGGELVKQQDYFHPGTREAIMKTPAHGKIKATTMIFQARNSTRKRRSAGFGIMVTASGGECHVNDLHEEKGVNPEHMLAHASKNHQKKPVKLGRTLDKKEHHYVTSHMTATEIISPDDDRIQLTETMKKECKDKIIYYNREIDLVSGEDFKEEGVSSVKDSDNSRYKKMFPPQKKNSFVPACVPSEINYKYTETEVANCGTWTYEGVSYTENGTAHVPLPVTRTKKHFHTVWTIAVQCCTREKRSLFPCDYIIDGFPPPKYGEPPLTDEQILQNRRSEQAFSTAFKMSWTSYGCMGMSRYCEWDKSDTTYTNVTGVDGACTSRCTSYCNNFGYYRPANGSEPAVGKPGRGPGYQATNAAYPNGCFKCYGMFPGFLDPNDPFKVDPYMNGMSESGPCTGPNPDDS